VYRKREGTKGQLLKENMNNSQVKIFYSALNRMNKVLKKYSRYFWYTGLKTCYICFAKLKFKYAVQVHLSVTHKVSLCFATDCCASLLPLQSILDFWCTRCKRTYFSSSYFGFLQSLVFHQCPVLSMPLFFIVSSKNFATDRFLRKSALLTAS